MTEIDRAMDKIYYSIYLYNKYFLSSHPLKVDLHPCISELNTSQMLGLNWLFFLLIIIVLISILPCLPELDEINGDGGGGGCWWYWWWW